MYTFFRDVVAKELLVKRTINQHGGTLRILEKIKAGGVGIGGVRYMGGLPEIDKLRDIEDTISTSFEVIRNGFIIRFRNVQFHSMVICKIDAIKSIHLYKEPDQLRLQGSSIFTGLMNRGVKYETSRIFATPAQLVRIGTITLTITIGDVTLTFENMDGFWGKLQKYFRQPIFVATYSEDITPYEVLPASDPK